MGIYGSTYGPVYGGGPPAAGSAQGGFKWTGSAVGVSQPFGYVPTNYGAGAFSWRGSAVGSAVSLDAGRFIDAPLRNISYNCTVNGQPYPVLSFTTDAQLKDVPAAVSLIGGVAASQAQITLPRTLTQALSPFQGIAPQQPLMPVGAPVTLSVSFWPGTPGVGDPVFTGRIFTGYLQTFQLDALSGPQFTALDAAYLCGGKFSPPMAAFNPALRSKSATPDYSPLAPTEAALRLSGIYLTPLPSHTDAQMRARYLLSAVSGYGGNMPEVGELLSSGIVNSRGQGAFGPDVWRAEGSTFRAQNVTRRPFGRLTMDGWITIAPGSSTAVVVRAFSDDGTGGRAALQMVGGQAQFIVSGYGGVHYLAVAGNPADGVPHYWRGAYQLSADRQSVTISIQLDGATQTATAPASVDDFALWEDNVTGDDTVIYPDPRCSIEAFEMWGVPVGDGTVAGVSRYGWAPGTPSVVAASSVRLQAVVGDLEATCWETIQQLAAAESALAWFDADGTFHRDTLQVFNARKLGAPAFSYGAGQVDNLPVSVASDGARRAVSAQVQRWSVTNSTGTTPVWAADTQYTAAAGATTVLRIASDVRGLHLHGMLNTIGPTSGPNDGWSHYQAVNVGAVGDPAAQLITNLAVTAVPTATGFDITVVNRNPFAVAFYSPDLDAPYLQIHGTRVAQGAPVTVTADGNPTAAEDLQLDDNPWRADMGTTRRLVRAVAAGTYNPLPELANITVAGDPRRRLGELGTLQVAKLMPLPERCLVVSMSMAGDAGSRFSMSLGVRPIGPSAGWLAGVPGRSEAGVSTYAPNR